MFEDFCNEQFWDINQTWNSQNPEFSTCFENTIFISVPCLLYSIIFLIHLYFLPRPESYNPLPWTWLNVTKTLLAASLWCISCIWLGITLHERASGNDVPSSAVLSACSKVLVFLLITLAMLRHRFVGVVTSYALSIFWLLFTFCCIFMFRSAIIKHFALDSTPLSNVIFILSMLFYPIVFVQLILSAVIDKRKFALLQETRVKEDLSFLASLTFVYFIKCVHLSRKRLLTVADLAYTSKHVLAANTYEAFAKHFKYFLLSEQMKDLNLLWALIKAFWPWFVGTIIYNVLFVCMYLIPPLLLDRVIHFVEDDFYVWRGYLFVSLLFLVDFIAKLLQNHSINMLSYSSNQFQTSLMGALFRKNLQMSTNSRKDYPSGTIMSLLTVDVKRLQWFTIQLSTVISSPLRIATIMFILWQYIGVAAIAGIVVICVLFPFTYYFMKLGLKYNDKQMDVKDIRLKLMNEILNGIKILKLYAWEIPFSTRITQARKDEVKWILYNYLTYIVSSFIYFCAPMFISIATFATYLLLDSKHVLDPTKAFVTLTLMEQLRYSLFDFPDAVADLIQFSVSLKRLKKFFYVENKNSEAVGKIPDIGDVLTIKDASFSWSSDGDCVIQNINLNVPRGKLIGIIGSVGAGKSSLLSSILGELYKRSGSIDLNGSIAYVPQQPWVLNRSLRKNILLVKHLNEEKYNKILDLCCLRPDLEILAAGDETEIGEKGINLSGGQKLRVNLAQAVYQDKEIYLLDDPLSAVDVHVRKSLFNDVIGNTGLLKNKTRILVTHDVSVLHNVDLIVSMKDGKIDEIGSYEDLMNNKGSVASFVEEHSNLKEAEENEARPILDRGISTISKMSYESHASGDEIFAREKEKNDPESKYRLTDDEKMEVGGVHRLVYWSYAKKMGLPLFLGAVFWVMMTNAFEASGSVWLSKWSSDAASNTTSTSYRLSVYAGFGLAQGFAVAIGYLCLVFGSTTASARYHREMLDNIMKSPMTFFDSTPVGRIINRFSTDLEVMDNQVLYRIDGWLTCVFSSIAAFVIIGMNTPIFLATLVPMAILYYVIQMAHLNTFRQIKRLESTGRSPVYSLFMESIQGVSSISAYNVKKEFIHEFEEAVDRCFICTFNTYICNRWLTFHLDCLGSFIVLSATSLAIYDRALLNPATVGLIVTYALTVTDALKWFVRMNSELEDKSISIERAEEYCRLKPEAPWDVAHPGLQDDWPQHGNILFENYSTKYRENLDLVLREINLSVNSCEKVGIIGRTGAGKSSITLALFRVIEPTSGTISIDDIDISKIGLHNLRSKLTIIPQDPVLFDGTLRMNLDPNDEYSDDAIWGSLEQSFLKPFVSNLNDGLAHNVEEGGANLSAGQRQLVCLARALLKNSKILVLDEATASVDMDTDSLIQNTIRTAFNDRTVITIAHRINTVLDYDKIVVMDNGQVVEVGNPGNLLENQNSRFYVMNKEAGLI